MRWLARFVRCIFRAVSCPIECRKTKTKVITLVNHNRCKQHNEPIRIRSKYMWLNWRQPRENVCGQKTTGFGLNSHWLRKWREFVNQSQSVVMQNQSECEITFFAQLKGRSICGDSTMLHSSKPPPPSKELCPCKVPRLEWGHTPCHNETPWHCPRKFPWSCHDQQPPS